VIPPGPPLPGSPPGAGDGAGAGATLDEGVVVVGVVVVVVVVVFAGWPLPPVVQPIGNTSIAAQPNTAIVVRISDFMRDLIPPTGICETC
jgi:hypothetical protein